MFQSPPQKSSQTAVSNLFWMMNILVNMECRQHTHTHIYFICVFYSRSIVTVFYVFYLIVYVCVFVCDERSSINILMPLFQQKFTMLFPRVFVVILLVVVGDFTFGDDFFYSKGRQKDKVGSSLVCAIGGVISHTKLYSILILCIGICGGVVGYWLGSKKQFKKVKTENNDLIEYIKLQTELYNLQERAWKDQYNELDKMYKDLHRDTLDRDYDEFKAPDTDGDDMISHSEVMNLFLILTTRK
jgi:NADH:ubiquinone oxidoreductase subunit 5 (subunit L)/multisubunit Na+/H+ antiporter MnhA subunit